MQILAEGLTDIGQRREANEDNLSLDREQSLFIVADGVGGQPAGEVASRLVVDRLPEILAAINQGESGAPGEKLVAAVQGANRLLIDTAAEKAAWQGMATTVVAAWCGLEEVRIANVGDSRAYLVRDQRMTQLSEDHTVLSEQRRAGLPEEELSVGMSHVLTRCLGSEREVEVSVETVSTAVGDRILLCSDGLTDSLSEEVILSVILSTRTPREGCRMLVELANRNGGRDNITVLLIYFEKDTFKSKFMRKFERRN